MQTMDAGCRFQRLITQDSICFFKSHKHKEDHCFKSHSVWDSFSLDWSRNQAIYNNQTFSGLRRWQHFYCSSRKWERKRRQTQADISGLFDTLIWHIHKIHLASYNPTIPRPYSSSARPLTHTFRCSTLVNEDLSPRSVNEFIGLTSKQRAPTH